MTPAARVQAAIEILDAVIAEALRGGAPADRVIVEWFRTRRFAGSGDRRAVRDLVFRAIRACGPVPVSGRAAMLRLAQDDAAVAGLFDGSRHGPAVVVPGEAVAEGGLAPAWLAGRLAASGVEGAALAGRAALDVRVNVARVLPEVLVLPEAGLAVWPEVLPAARRFAAGTGVEAWDAYAAGLIEVQDAGSQLAAKAVAAVPGETVVDLCAGAGGKTLALAADMSAGGGFRGRLVACDADRARLARLGPRAERAGVVVETRLLDGGREGEGLADLAGVADAVLVDAPCSGTGTWRRNPEARWRLSPRELERVCGLQARLMDVGAELVRPGGRLVFVTCSLLDEEGAGAFAAFLARSGWAAEAFLPGVGEARGAGLRLSPARDDCDGFFIAVARRTC